MESLHADGATPGSFWCNLGRKVVIRHKLRPQETYLHRRHQAVHVIPSVTIITEEQLVIILTGATQSAGLALDALPGVLLHANHHVVRELQASWVACEGDIKYLRF